MSRESCLLFPISLVISKQPLDFWCIEHDRFLLAISKSSTLRKEVACLSGLCKKVLLYWLNGQGFEVSDGVEIYVMIWGCLGLEVVGFGEVILLLE